MILTDNQYVEGSSSPITCTTPDGDTYQTRQLDDGREFGVLKNLPTEAQFTTDVTPATVHWTPSPTTG